MEIIVAGDATIDSVLDANGTLEKIKLEYAQVFLVVDMGVINGIITDGVLEVVLPILHLQILLNLGVLSLKAGKIFHATTLVAGQEPGGGSYAGVGGRPEPVGGRVNIKLLMHQVALMVMLILLICLPVQVAVVEMNAKVVVVVVPSKLWRVVLCKLVLIFGRPVVVVEPEVMKPAEAVDPVRVVQFI